MSNLYRQSQRDNSGVRLPWEPEETRLLLKLVETHGPNWSLMIRLHGAEGTESDMFKNRTTVALKDKAVNIKKKLIRVGEPVPEGFENVKVPSSGLYRGPVVIRRELIGR